MLNFLRGSEQYTIAVVTIVVVIIVVVTFVFVIIVYSSISILKELISYKLLRYGDLYIMYYMYYITSSLRPQLQLYGS